MPSAGKMTMRNATGNATPSGKTMGDTIANRVHPVGLIPRKIVEELDKYIIGQDQAKRAVAIAVRNRWRRRNVDPEMRDEVAPKNIILIGPTGVGKTEIARRLSNLTGAPFLKVEASKFTEVGYVGRDVESMIRDLVEVSVNRVRGRERKRVKKRAAEKAQERLLDVLLPRPDFPAEETEAGNVQESYERSREKMLAKLEAGELEKREVELTVDSHSNPMVQIFSGSGIEHMGFDMQSLFDRLTPSRGEQRKVTVEDARKLLVQQEADNLLDREKIRRQGLEEAQESGIVFIDELDKVAVKTGDRGGHGPDVSREGVQRDLLPIVEGTTVSTRHGPIETDHVLFIAAGAFHMTKPSDLIPELQGRFPIRVELSALDRDDFIRIMLEPKNALTKQYQALLGTEGVKLRFRKDAIKELAGISEEVNQRTQNIGARRLYTVFEKLLEDLLFEAPDIAPASVTVTASYVKERLSDIVADEDLNKYIL
jgi:ATP-dependent HslUV protease ATP-binding subunit HslU